jgi:ATP-dependent DNA helicase RecQ
LIQRFEARERNDVDRVQKVVEFAEHSGCIVRHLLHHFGQDLNRNCGHCSSCSGGGGGTIRATAETKAPQLNVGKMTALRKQQTTALSTPRQIARFCCGLSSPFLSQTKLNKHPDFGNLAEVPFQIVIKAAEQVA